MSVTFFSADDGRSNSVLDIPALVELKRPLACHPGRCRPRAEETYGCQFSELRVGSERPSDKRTNDSLGKFAPPHWPHPEAQDRAS
jgi:hypothetical protein